MQFSDNIINSVNNTSSNGDTDVGNLYFDTTISISVNNESQWCK